MSSQEETPLGTDGEYLVCHQVGRIWLDHVSGRHCAVFSHEQAHALLAWLQMWQAEEEARVQAYIAKQTENKHP